MPDSPRPQQRAALLAWYLAHGERLTVAQAARLTRLDRVNAWRLLLSLARVIPVTCEAGIWQRGPGIPRSLAYTPQQRAALLTWHFAGGAILTSAQAAKITGLRRNTAYELLCALSAVLPLYDSTALRVTTWQVTAYREAEA